MVDGGPSSARQGRQRQGSSAVDAGAANARALATDNQTDSLSSPVQPSLIRLRDATRESGQPELSGGGACWQEEAEMDGTPLQPSRGGGVRKVTSAGRKATGKARKMAGPGARAWVRCCDIARRVCVRAVVVVEEVVEAVRRQRGEEEKICCGSLQLWNWTVDGGGARPRFGKGRVMTKAGARGRALLE